ncbi:MAG: MFS transporter [Williamsia sp.]|nr:MFS transporter [Williamsia sp.]
MLTAPTASKRVVNGWAMYDWANSVYNLVITSTIFPAYYDAVTGDGNSNTVDYVKFLGRTYESSSLYNYVLALAFLVVALMSPILSSIADYKGNKRSFLRFFCTMGSLACAGLFFFTGKEAMGTAVVCSIIACIGYWSSLVFYNSYLPEIAAPHERDAVSAKGFSMGYIGSVLMQLICFLFVFKPEWFGMQGDKTLPSRFSFLLVGVWWFGFAQITLFRLPKGTPAARRPEHNVLANGFIELKKVLVDLAQQPVLKRFLISYFFYNMGVQTVMLVATLFGSKELSLPASKLIVTILIIQLVAILGAWSLAGLSRKIGNIRTLIFIVFVWILICLSAYYIAVLHNQGVNVEIHFYALASLVGLVMGGIQSLSRSTYSKLMPVTKDTTSYFSFFDVTEKIAIVIGMFSFGYITELTQSMKNSVLVVMVFFVIGLVLLFITLAKEKQLSKLVIAP